MSSPNDFDTLNEQVNAARTRLNETTEALQAASQAQQAASQAWIEALARYHEETAEAAS